MNKIYLADDDEDEQELFTTAFLEVFPNMQVVCASDGISLISLLNSSDEKPDAIFLDINMPQMDGHDCIIFLKKEARFKQIPVIVYSTSRASADIDKMYRQGADLFLSKPISFSELKQMIKNVCRIDFKKNYKRANKENFHITTPD